MIGPMPGTVISRWHAGSLLAIASISLNRASMRSSSQRLSVELIGGLGRHELHRWPLHRLGDRLRVAEVVLLSLRIRANVLRWHQPGIVTKTLELATEMMCPDASLHPDQAGRHVGKP